MTIRVNKFNFPINIFNFNGKNGFFPIKIENIDGKNEFIDLFAHLLELEVLTVLRREMVEGKKVVSPRPEKSVTKTLVLRVASRKV